MPVLPYLPPVAPKSAAPVTGQVAATLVAAALHFQDAAVAPATARPAKRRRKRLITLGIIIAVPLLLAVIFRNSAFVEGFTGKSYDSNPLPTDVVDEDPAEIRPVTVI
jgi:hypothetical protein